MSDRGGYTPNPITGIQIAVIAAILVLVLFVLPLTQSWWPKP